MKTHDRLGPLRNVDFLFLLLKSTQSHSPEPYSAHTECTFEFEIARGLHT